MELNDYLKILGRRIVWLILPIIIVGAGFYFYGTSRPVSYDGLATMSFIKKGESPTAESDYKFDNYYALQASQNLSDIASGWLAESPVISLIYESASVTLPTVGIMGYDRLVKVQKLAGASLQVTVNAPSNAEAERLASSATKLVKNRMEELVNGGLLDKIEIFESAPLVELHKLNLSLLLVAGIFVGGILGLFLVFLMEFIQTEKK